jgi:hypothetical protein
MSIELVNRSRYSSAALIGILLFLHQVMRMPGATLVKIVPGRHYRTGTWGHMNITLPHDIPANLRTRVDNGWITIIVPSPRALSYIGDCYPLQRPRASAVALSFLDTAVHELAHVIDFRRNPERFNSRAYSGYTSSHSSRRTAWEQRPVEKFAVTWTKRFLKRLRSGPHSETLQSHLDQLTSEIIRMAKEYGPTT